MRPDVQEIFDRFRKAGCQVSRADFGPGNAGTTVKAPNFGFWVNDKFATVHGLELDWNRFVHGTGPDTVLVSVPHHIAKQIYDSQADCTEV